MTPNFVHNYATLSSPIEVQTCIIMIRIAITYVPYNILASLEDLDPESFNMLDYVPA